MGRPAGRRNPGYDARRHAIAQRLLMRLAQPEGAKASLRDLAQSAGVSVSTLRHYFGSRQGALQAAIGQVRVMGEPWMEIAANDQLDQPLADSLLWFFHLFVEGWRTGVGAMVSESISAGTGDQKVGVSAVEDVLEPILAAIEARLGHHQQAGELEGQADLRHAAIALFSPVFVALLHQETLDGVRCRPLDLHRFLEDHVARFAKAWSN